VSDRQRAAPTGLASFWVFREIVLPLETPVALSRYLAGNSSLFRPPGRSQRRLVRHGRLAVLIDICSYTEMLNTYGLDGLRTSVGSISSTEADACSRNIRSTYL
jgi:hypothetical protein